MFYTGDSRIHPEKIMHPFQLMAAWFVMLIILVSVILFAAAKIREPAWATGFLVIFSIILSVLVMVAVFLMLTKFRPHLQGPKEYAEWLKDERRYRGQAISQLSIQEITPRPQSDTSVLSVTNDPVFLREIITHQISVANSEDADKIIATLRTLGFNAKIYRGLVPSRVHLSKVDKKIDHAAIWIGSRIPPRVVLLAIKSVIDIWPHLKYMHLSSDGTNSPPDDIHDQIYLGGATSTASKYSLQPWLPEQMKAIPADITVDEFHELIRSKYAKNMC